MLTIKIYTIRQIKATIKQRESSKWTAVLNAWQVIKKKKKIKGKAILNYN